MQSTKTFVSCLSLVVCDSERVWTSKSVCFFHYKQIINFKMHKFKFGDNLVNANKNKIKATVSLLMLTSTLTWFEPNFPEFFVILNINKCCNTEFIQKCSGSVQMGGQRMEVIFFQGSHSIRAKREHFRLIAFELKKGFQVADVGKTDQKAI